MQLRGNIPPAERWWQTLERVLDYPLLRLGESALTLGTIGTAAACAAPHAARRT